MKPVEPRELINKYLKGECSPLEEKLLHEWYDSFEKKDDPLASLPNEEKKLLQSRMFERIVSKTGIEPQRQAKVRQWNFYYYAAASVAAILLLVWGSLFYPEINKGKSENPVISSLLTYKNTSNHLVKHVFPDGSIAWMRPATQISYSQTFNRGAPRFIRLQGEAFFDVTKNPRRPFIIETGKVYTKVLGTSFNVKSYKGDKATEVSVVTGKVLVYRPLLNEKVANEQVFLLPRQKVLVPASHERFIKKQETNRAMEIWQKNDLSFNNMPVHEVVKALNERFKTAIIIKDNQINNYLLTADFTDVNLPSVLELLSKSLGIAYEINNDNITMSRN